VQFYRSAIGKKWIMAITGLALVGFLIAHMIGNLKMYLGREDIDAYSHALHTLLHPIMPDEVVLWILRAGLLAMLILHIHAAATLTMMNKRARPVAYQSPRDYIAVNFASKSMRYTGLIVFLYLIFHLLDLTLGKSGAQFTEGHVYDNLVNSLSRWPVAIAYILANIAISIHLFHGIWSAFQSLGLNSPQYNPARRFIAAAISGLLLVGNVSFPIMILAGVVH
jgi:succinate dehydrogenase / fumarate reductase cytochrome b subunit